MATLNNLPIYKIEIDENDDVTGIQFLSCVDDPAIDENWMAFAAANTMLRMSTNDKQIVTGPVLIPNLPIYRTNDKIGEYYSVFEPDVIEKIAKKFMKEQKTLNVNYMHQNDSQIAEANIFEFWITKSATVSDAKAIGFDVPAGTLMASVHFADSKFWNEQVKTGNVRGFSIEGFLNLKMKMNADDVKAATTNNTKQNMENTKIKLAEAVTTDGTTIYTDADTFAVDANVWVLDANGNQSPAPDGDYTLDNGAVITVANGIVTAVADPNATPAAAAAAVPAVDTAQSEIMQALKSMMSKMSKIDSMMSKMSKIESKIEGMEKKIDETDKNVSAVNTKMSKTPGASTKTDKADESGYVTLSTSKKYEDMTPEEKRAHYMRAVANERALSKK